MSRVLPPDLEHWLCDHLRAEITDVPGLQVGSKRPETYGGSHPLIVIRDDGGSQTDRLAFDRSVGVTVTGWTRGNNAPCRQLARRVYAILTDDTIGLTPDSPIAAVDESGCNGPYPVTDDMDVARYYLTVEYLAVGEPQ